MKKADRKKKLLMCASRSSHLTGFHTPWLKWFSENGWQVFTASQGEGTMWGEHLSLPFEKRLISLKNLGSLWKLTKFIRREKFRLIVSHASLASFLTRLAVVFSGDRQARLVQVCHGYLFRDDGTIKSRLYLFCESLFSGRIACLLVMNDEDEAIARKYSLCRKIVRISSMGLCPLSSPPKSREVLRRELDIDENSVCFLAVGEFSARKNQERLILAFEKVGERFPNTRLYFAGEGVLLEKCRQLAGKGKAAGQIVFLGHRKDIRYLLPAFDVLLTASKSEGLPFCVLEALDAGLPVIASQIKGHRELVRHGENGLLFSLGDPAEPAKSMEEWLLSPKSRWKKRDISAYRISAVMKPVLDCYLGKDGEKHEDAFGQSL